MAYTSITQWQEEKERALFDRQLLADDPSTVSHGTESLMALMGVRMPTRPPARKGDA